jgi:His/Glu/Gln/Arg/opine family amino acid ABC transporter permease subunit
VLDVLFINFPYLLKGATITLALAVCCISTGSILGTVLGVVGAMGPGSIRAIITAYVFLIRGTPALVLMFLAYFALPAFGINIKNIYAVGMALTLYTGAYVTEIIRGSIIAVPVGQTIAAKALGMRWYKILSQVTIPQALRLAIPPLLNNSVVMVKATSYASIVGVWELTYAATEVVERTLAPFEIFLGVMFLYFIICYPLSIASQYLERKFAFLS